MNEGRKGLRIRKTKEAWRAYYKTRTTIQVMSDSEAKPLFGPFFFRKPHNGISYSRQITQAYSTEIM